LIYDKMRIIPRGNSYAIQRGFAVLSAHYRTVYIELDGILGANS
jgi:hypothetical protein